MAAAKKIEQPEAAHSGDAMSDNEAKAQLLDKAEAPLAKQPARAQSPALTPGDVSADGPSFYAEQLAPETPPNANLKWYVVHTYSGFENRAKASLEERIRQQKLGHKFGEILVPTENVVELAKGGQKRTTKRKFFPGYMLVQMELEDGTWHLVKSTPKITGFVGDATKPPSVPEKEVLRLTQQIDEGTLKPKPRVQFEDGENVRVIDGPFQNFNGVVEAVNADKSKVRVLVSIFGRSTPVELDFIQVEKA